MPAILGATGVRRPGIAGLLPTRAQSGVPGRLDGTVTDPATQGIPRDGVPEPPATPYADALRANALGGWTRWAIPAHQDQPERHPALAALAGPEVLAMDIPMFTEGVDLPAEGRPRPVVSRDGSAGPSPIPYARSLELAAEAWGARRTWFLTDGASQGNHAACLALRWRGQQAVVQRSVHTSVIDGAILAGLRLEFVLPHVNIALGIAHGVTPADLDDALTAHPGAMAAYVVSPSYFGAVSDVSGLAEVAHRHGVPLVVDEAWGSHFGFHPDLPPSALSCGADVVVSSTHKLAGSLTQSAMLHLGDGRFADELEPLLDRALRTFQTTSPSALLLGSLDVARRDLILAARNGGIAQSIEDAERVRSLLAEGGRYADPGPAILDSPDVVGIDPLHVVVDTRSGGLSGYQARALLERQARIHVELATQSVIVGIVGAGSWLDADYIAAALHSLPREDDGAGPRELSLPAPGARALDVREAFLSSAEVVPWQEAVGRVSADSLAAYPPGVPNVLPGEVVTAEVVQFLRETARSPYGWVRGSVDPLTDHLRVVC